jgi:3-oxoacyl-[acyl-carrier protein] reductase
MDLQLEGKVAAILASSSGIGKGVATVLSQEGCSLAICGRRPDKLEETEAEIINKTGNEVFSKATDVSDAHSLTSFFDAVYEHYGQLDILVCNAGGPPAGDSTTFKDKDYISAFELSLMSVIRSCSYVLPEMKKQKNGKIITITSTSVKCALNNMILSNTFRSSTAAFSKSIAMEAAEYGVRVHTVMPGPFMTDRVNELGNIAAKRKNLSFEEWKISAEKNTPLNRFGYPEEMGNLIAFLVSDKSSYMNGTCIAIDGGILTTIV